MQNNFEREVRQKLDELRMQPSVPVWEKVQLKIEPERKKRRGIFWMLLLVGVVGAFGIVMLLTKEKLSVSQQQARIETTSKERKEKVAEKTPVHSGQTLSAAKTSKDSTGSLINHSALPAVANRIQTKQPVGEALPKSTILNENHRVHDEQLELFSVSKTADTDKQYFFVRPLTVALAPALVAPSISTLTSATPSSHQLSTVTAALKAVDSMQKQRDSSSKLVRNTKGGWRKMVAVSVGYSNYNSGLFSLIGVEKTVAADIRNQPFNSVGGGLVQNNSQQRGTASSVLAGLSVSVGGFIEKPISSRTELMLGLSYNFYRTHQPLGGFNDVDTTVSSAGRNVALSGFYTTGDTSRYTNRFHAIGLPIGINWQVHKRLPLFASITAAYSRVISIDAIAYSSSSNLFFEQDADEDYLKHHLPLSIGLAYRFRISKTQSLAVGPTATYQLLRLNTVATNNAQHLSFVGIQTSLRF